MLTMIVQPPAGIDVPLAIVMLPLPAVAVTFAQVPVLPVVLTVIAPGATGSVSVKTAVVVIATGIRVADRDRQRSVARRAKVAAPNTFETVGRASTSTLADAPQCCCRHW